MKKTIFIALTIIASHTLAQSPKTVEANLLESYKQIEYWSGQQGTDKTGAAGEKLEDAKLDFSTKLKKWISNPSTINWRFKSLIEEHVNIATSADKQLRIYSWDTWSGGTMHFFENMVQYKNGSQIAITDIPTDAGGDPGSFYPQIFTAKLAGKTYYLVLCNGIYSSKDCMQAVRVFAITNGKLDINVKLFKTGSGLRNKLLYDYDFSSVIDWKVRPSITYDAQTQTIHLPLVVKGGKVTHNEILYKFSGQYFERMAK